VINVNRLKLCRSITAGQNLSRPLTWHSDNPEISGTGPNSPDQITEDADTEQISYLPHSQKLLLALPAMNDNEPCGDDNENESFETDRSNDVGHHTQDPSWSPSRHHKRTLRHSPSESWTNEIQQTPGNRYSLRPRGIRIEELSREHIQSDNENLEEETNDEISRGEQESEPQLESQSQNEPESVRETPEPLPYNLRPLPGRHLSR
jgi:hypothetical protein